MIRVLVVDDSASARAAIAAVVRAGDVLEIAGEARNGAEAVELTKRLKPSVVTMDLEMPELDGFDAIREIMTEQPTPIVVVSAMSRLSEAEAAARALGAGALAVLRKLPGPTSPDYARAARELRETIAAMADVKLVRRVRPSPARVAGMPVTREPVRVIAIAASTGGPAALQVVLRDLPKDFSVPVLVVQHIASGFTKGLATWLAHATHRPVTIAEEGEALRGGAVYVAAEDRHFGVTGDGRAFLSSDPPLDGFRPSATFLFRSVAGAYGAGALAVILTGMGRDGVDGLRDIRQAGGSVIAQDEETSVVFGMPGAAVAERLADAVLPLQAIGLRLAAAMRPSAKRQRS